MLAVNLEASNMLKGLPVIALVMGVVLGAGGLAAGLKPGVYMAAEANRRFSASFADEKAAATIAEKTAGAQKLAGYFNLYWDAKAGKLWLEIDEWDTEFLYQSGLSAGVGSNDIGLDRGQLGARGIVRFERSGPKVLLIQENL